MEREAQLQGILPFSQKPHLSCSPLKELSVKAPLMESLAERCPTTRALHSSIKVSGIQAPPPTYQVPLGWKGAPMERDMPISGKTYLPGSPVKERPPPWRLHKTDALHDDQCAFLITSCSFLFVMRRSHVRLCLFMF
jgi:hypothetical protein